MKISSTMGSELNSQITKEFFSAYTYLSMSSYFETLSLRGFASWMKKQAQEELQHGLKMYQYLVDRDFKVVLLPISQPRADWSSPLEVFKAAYAQECDVTLSINEIYNSAVSEKDNATVNFLNWFLEEQVEEEALVQEVIGRLALVGDNKAALLQLDAELEKRS
jgi:ferritin